VVVPDGPVQRLELITENLVVALPRYRWRLIAWRWRWWRRRRRRRRRRLYRIDFTFVPPASAATIRGVIDLPIAVVV
jgi:hypothetical protein